MSPADILALILLGLLASYCAYRAISWIADRIIGAVAYLTRFEKREGIGGA